MEKIRQLPIIDLQKKYGNRAFQFSLVNDSDAPIKVRMFGNGKTFAEIVDKADPDIPEPEPALQPYVEVTYAEITELANAGQLVPGQTYCITDYNPQTVTINASSTLDVQYTFTSTKSVYTLVTNWLYVTAKDTETVFEDAVLINRNLGSYRRARVIYDAPFVSMVVETPKWSNPNADDYRGCITRFINDKDNWDLPYDAFNIIWEKYNTHYMLTSGLARNIHVDGSKDGYMHFVCDPGSGSLNKDIYLGQVSDNSWDDRNIAVLLSNGCKNVKLHNYSTYPTEEAYTVDVVHISFCKNVSMFRVLSSRLDYLENVRQSLGGWEQEYMSELYNIETSATESYINIGCKDIRIGRDIYMSADTIGTSCQNVSIFGGFSMNTVTIGNSSNNIHIDGYFGNVQVGRSCNNVNIVGSGSVGDYCENVDIRLSSAVTIGDSCKDIEISKSNNITLGNQFVDVKIDYGCSNIKFEDGDGETMFHASTIRIGKDCRSITFQNDETTAEQNQFQNITVMPGVESQTIDDIARAQKYTTIIGYGTDNQIHTVPFIDMN